MEFALSQFYRQTQYATKPAERERCSAKG